MLVTHKRSFLSNGSGSDSGAAANFQISPKAPFPSGHFYLVKTYQSSSYDHRIWQQTSVPREQETSVPREQVKPLLQPLER